ncbi:MAG TPA: helix-hairpin-helix domain-containing protein [Bacteroidia bacterium]|nr:helix-hairpin-helix domain-containing protein [Bacteroidia bacterium]
MTFNLSLLTYSQDTTKTDDSSIQQQLEIIGENSTDEEADYTNLIEVLIYANQNPINLNKTNKEELQALGLLNDIQINHLLSHIEKNGKLITIYELQGINGFDLQTIQKILPYVKVTDTFTTAHFSTKEMFKNGQHTILLRYGRTIEDQTGFSSIDSASLANSMNSRYIGSPDKIYARYRFTYGTNISWGVTAEKDQGELFFKGNQKFKYDWYENSLKGNQKTGFDFYSAHFYLKNVKFIRALAIGDYQATFGQGLTLWSGQAFGKSSEIMSTKRSAGGIRAYTSVDENRFMRGAATTLGYKKFEATAFYSRKRVDANISDTTDTGEAAVISSLQETGYHSTSSEIADKDAILQTMIGGNVSYKGRKFNVGVSALSYQLDVDYNRSLSYYNQFEYSSSKNFNVGVDYNFIVKNFNFFGEAGMSQSGGKAFVNGVLISLDPRLSLTVLHRYYERNFQNLMSNGFGESTTPSNEKGLYIGAVAKPTNKTTVTAYYDRFEFPWLRYQANAPSYGNDYMAQFNYTPSKKVDMYVRVRTRDKQKNATGIDLISFLVPVKQSNYRFNISYTISKTIKLRNRIELIDYKLDDNKTEKGYLVYQDVVYSKLGKPLSVTFRYAVFQTDSYDARIYAYENDIPGSFSIPAYYDRGSRFYIMLDYNLTRRIELWLRYSQTFYDNKNVISEGSLTEIQGNTKSEIKAQVRFKF